MKDKQGEWFLKPVILFFFFCTGDQLFSLFLRTSIIPYVGP